MTEHLQPDLKPAVVSRRSLLRGLVVGGGGIAISSVVHTAMRRMGVSERGLAAVPDYLNFPFVDTLSHLEPESVCSLLSQLDGVIAPPRTVILEYFYMRELLEPRVMRLNTYFVPFVSSYDKTFSSYEILPRDKAENKPSFMRSGNRLYINKRYLSREISTYFLNFQLSHELYHLKAGDFSPQNDAYNEMSAQVVAAWVLAQMGQESDEYKHSFLYFLRRLAYSYVFETSRDDPLLRSLFSNKLPALREVYERYDRQSDWDKLYYAEIRNRYYIQPLNTIVRKLQAGTPITHSDIFIPSGRPLTITSMIQIIEQSGLTLPVVIRT